jgi:hypothetical protein
MTAKQYASIPAFLDYDPAMSFAEIVWYAQTELDLIAEGERETAANYTPRQIERLEYFVRMNRG